MIAAVWQNLFAHDSAVRLSLASRAVLPLAVWLIYLTDRLLDTAKGLPMQRTARHEFSCRCRACCYAMAGAAALFSTISVLYLPLPVIRSGLATLCAVFAYLLIVHGVGGSVRRWLPKEAAVGLIFAVGSVLAPATWSSHPLHLLFPALLFGLLCWANSAAIEVWEGGRVDAVSAWMVGHLKTLATTTALVCLVRAVSFPLEHCWLALLFAALGYGVIEYLRPDLNPDLLRVSIDLPLLAPLLLIGLK